MQFPLRKRWTKLEKALLLTPLLVGVGYSTVLWVKSSARHRYGLPDVVLQGSGVGFDFSRMVLSRDGSLLAAATVNENSAWNEVKFWDARTLRPKSFWRTTRLANSYEETYLRGLAISPTSQCIFVARGSSPLSALDANTRLVQWRSRPIYNCGDMTPLPDGKTLFVSNYFGEEKPDGTLVDYVEFSRFRMSDGHLMGSWKVDSSNDTFALSSDGRTIALIARDWTRSSGHNVQLRRTLDGKLIRTLNLTNPSAMNWAPDGKTLVVVHDFWNGNFLQQRVVCLRPSSGQVLWTLREPVTTPSQKTMKYQGVTFSPDGRIVAVYAQHLNQVLLLDSSTGEITGMLRLQGNSTQRGDSHPLIFSPDNKRLFARAQDSICVWNLD